MQVDPLQHLAEQTNDLLKTPVMPGEPYILGRTNYQDVYDLAYGLTVSLTALDQPEQPVCLYTEDKTLTAAAMLAAASHAAPQLLFPYALNPQVLKEIHTATGAMRVVTDQPHDLPSPLKAVDFKPDAFPAAGLDAAAMDKTIVSLFTGGSTGTPQVWPKTISNLFGEAFFMVDHFKITHRDRFVCTTVPYHIYGLLFSVLVPLAATAGVAAETLTFPHEIRNAITRHGATIFAGVPMHYRVLRDTHLPKDTLHLAISSAGKLEPEDGAAFFQKTGVGVTEIYGATETGGVALRNRANNEVGLTPLRAVHTRIEGERLYVRSPFLSPNLETDADGYFLTGDRVNPETGGGFMLLGRADGIVKVGGKRVDLEGVRACMMDLPDITDALVMSLPAKGARENDIVALVEGHVDISAIRQALSGKVESYALPRRIIAVDKIPMSAAGKYDRQAVIELITEENAT